MYKPHLLSITCLILSHACWAENEAIELSEQAFHIQNKQYYINVPKGYQLEFLTELDKPRLLNFNNNGELFIGSKSGNVYRLTPPYNSADTLIELNDYPHSVAVRNKEIYIAQTDGLYHAPYQAGQKSIPHKHLKLLAALPDGRGHTSRTVAIGPDKRIYVSLGITGNCDDEYLDDSYSFQNRRGGVLVLDENTNPPHWKTFASGLRNPVGFAWHPTTKQMYASNNGPDHLGFTQPPEYFSHLQEGSFHGMPWFQFDGKNIFRDDCIEKTPPRPITDVPPPVATFPARNAPMGVTFVTTGALDKTLEHDAIVALRGSWGTRPHGNFIGDRSSRRTPRIVSVRFENGEAVRVEDLVTGFQLDDGNRWARPVGVAIGPDGALYFTSDSGAEGLYRMRRVKSQQ